MQKDGKEIKHLDGPCITHRDFKPGNVLVDNKKIKALIDFEICKYGFSEDDFSQMDYLVFDEYKYLKKCFLEGYQEIRKVPDFERVLPVLRISKALGAIGFAVSRNMEKEFHKNIFNKNLIYLRNFFI